MDELARELHRIRAEIARLQAREAEVWGRMKALGSGPRPGWPLQRTASPPGTRTDTHPDPALQRVCALQ